MGSAFEFERVLFAWAGSVFDGVLLSYVIAWVAIYFYGKLREQWIDANQPIEYEDEEAEQVKSGDADKT